jgi:LacI family transcriptional regulator
MTKLIDQSPRNSRKRRKVTIKDIAERVNVSSATVSRVLNMDETLSVSSEVKRSIIEAAEAMNYTTPRQRRMHSSKTKSRRVALVHILGPEEEMRDPYYVGMRLGIERRCVEAKLDPKLVRIEELQTNPNILNDMAGTILIGCQPDENVQKIKDQTEHLVAADFDTGVDDVDVVTIDMQKSTRKVMKAILDQGITKISFVGWEGNPKQHNAPAAGRRFHTYFEMLNERGIYCEDYVKIGEKSEASGYKCAKEVLSLPERPEAIVTANDTVAVGVYRAIQEMGLRIPEDVSVASFNDISLASFLTPPLTTLRIPAEEIGAAAVEQLLERIEGRNVAKHTEFATSLIYRKSLKLS